VSAIPLALLGFLLLYDLVRFGGAAADVLRTPYSRDYG
jgi:hypothetical protein